MSSPMRKNHLTGPHDWDIPSTSNTVLITPL